jgi:hypothetical protein
LMVAADWRSDTTREEGHPTPSVECSEGRLASSTPHGTSPGRQAEKIDVIQ